MGIIAINECQGTVQAVSKDVDRYLLTALGPAYTASNPTQQVGGWTFLIRYQDGLLPRPCIVGRILVNKDYPVTHNGTAGLMKLLTKEQVPEIRATAAWEVARQCG